MKAANGWQLLSVGNFFEVEASAFNSFASNSFA
jgi:hypothetical protein